MARVDRYVICDLDGTLFNIEERLKFIKKEKKDWVSFSHPRNIKNDEINHWCADILTALRVWDGVNIVFVSGRMKKEGVEEATRDMINRALSKYISYELYMREDKDYRADTIIKKEIYDEHLKDRNIMFVIDDRSCVVEMWRSLGLICLQCAKGDF